MRTISISTEAFAKLWSCREDGEESEDDILRRILGCHKLPAEDTEEAKPQGFYDSRHKVHFPEGFEIFRHYKGVEYRAVATHGHWLLQNTNGVFTSLNQLTVTVADGRENAWVSWNYIAEDGEEKKISTLRDQSAVKIRSAKPKMTLKDLVEMSKKENRT